MDTDPIELTPPDLGPHRTGNTGVPFVHSFQSATPGPHVVLNAVMHGNELCGAIVLDRFLRGGLRPARGRLTLAFSNVEAFGRFDPAMPTASRFVDEDMNRVWAPERLAGDGSSVEARRAQALWPVFETADLLLDIHSMQNPTVPLMLCGASARGRRLATRLGYPGWIVADEGHAAGKRLIDHPRFTGEGEGPAAILVECGQHWRTESVPVAMETSLRFLRMAGVVDAAAIGAFTAADMATPPLPARLVDVVQAVTAATDDFTFMGSFQGMEIIPERGTVIARDGGQEIRTPHDDCILIMPARRIRAGQTAVRLGRIIG